MKPAEIVRFFVRCPRCGAEPSTKCRNQAGRVMRNHGERVTEYEERRAFARSGRTTYNLNCEVRG